MIHKFFEAAKCGIQVIKISSWPAKKSDIFLSEQFALLRNTTM